MLRLRERAFYNQVLMALTDVSGTHTHLYSKAAYNRNHSPFCLLYLIRLQSRHHERGIAREEQNVGQLASESSLGRKKLTGERNEASQEHNISTASPRRAWKLERRTSIRSPRPPHRGSLSSPPFHGANTISTGINVESQHLVRKVIWQHNITQIQL